MFFVGVSAQFIPYLLLSMTMLVCFVHQTKADEKVKATPVQISTQANREIRIVAAKQVNVRQTDEEQQDQPVISHRLAHKTSYSATIPDYSKLKRFTVYREKPHRAPPTAFRDRK
jgi:hypothetical protein